MSWCFSSVPTNPTSTSSLSPLLQQHNQPTEFFQADNDDGDDYHVETTTSTSTSTFCVFSDLVGLQSARHQLLNSFQLLDETAASRRRRPVILYGPRGCGKRSLARALAVHSGARFVQVNLNGSSAAMLNDVIETVRRATTGWQPKKTVLLLTDVDRLISSGGQGGNWRRLSDVIQSVSSSVYVVATTTSPDVVHPASLMTSSDHVNDASQSAWCWVSRCE